MWLCLDRLMPVRKDRPIAFELPQIEEAADLPRATSALLQGVAAGEITPSEAAELSRLHGSYTKTCWRTHRLRRLKWWPTGNPSISIRSRPTQASTCVEDQRLGIVPSFGRSPCHERSLIEP